MEKKKHIRLLILFSYFSSISISSTDAECGLAFCGHTEIRSPFRIIDQQPPSCGIPGFDLYCNNQSQTIIRFPSSHYYTVKRIDYDLRLIYIDQDFCKRNEINDLNITNAPFVTPNLEEYVFYNCSKQNSSLVSPSVPFPCLSSRNHSVIAIQRELFPHRRLPSSCKVIKSISVSVSLDGDIKSDMMLRWIDPCSEFCDNEGMPTSAKFGLSLGVGVPVTICIIGMICYMTFTRTVYSETHHQSNDVFPISIIPQPPSNTGLDGPTIESYPIMMLEERCRLPNDDSVCVICLSEYKTKELLKTIPECNHYFHLDCIDGWLKLKATCPVCRKMPESKAIVAPCSSTSANYVESS